MGIQLTKGNPKLNSLHNYYNNILNYLIEIETPINA